MAAPCSENDGGSTTTDSRKDDGCRDHSAKPLSYASSLSITDDEDYRSMENEDKESAEKKTQANISAGLPMPRSREVVFFLTIATANFTPSMFILPCA